MKKALLFLLLIGVAGVAIGYYQWNKPKENMSTSKAEETVDAGQLLTEYNANEDAANAKYLGKTIAVSGKVKETTQEDGTVKVMLETGQDFGVYCTLDSLAQHPRTDFPAGETVTLKGKCDGLNLDVQLSRCVEVKR
ncbi:MAG: hypothetical protein ABIO24_10320 [Saprospiraceae bacterium]